MTDGPQKPAPFESAQRAILEYSRILSDDLNRLAGESGNVRHGTARRVVQQVPREALLPILAALISASAEEPAVQGREISPGRRAYLSPDQGWPVTHGVPDNPQGLPAWQPDTLGKQYP